MQFTSDISLGNIAIIVTLIGIAIKIGMQVGAVQEVAKAQARVIEGHTQRLDRYESRLVDIVSDVSRLIGRIEATQSRLEKSTGGRLGEGGHGGHV